MPTHSHALVSLSPDQADALRALVNQLIPGTPKRPISAQQAARLAKRRTATVLEALRNNELPGKFREGVHGGRGEWLIDPSDVIAWATSARA